MKRLSIDEIREALPELEELRPLFQHLLSRSEPDRQRVWAGSARLGTVGSRLAPGDALEGQEMERLANVEAARLEALYDCTARALSALAAEDRAAATLALLDGAALEERRERPERAADFAEAAYRASRGERDQGPAALALRRWARASRAIGALTEALERYARSHEMALAMSDARGAAEAAIGAGNVLEEQGAWGDAAAWYRRALSALESVADPVPERWHALLNLHIVTRSGGDVGESIPMLEEAAEAAQEIDPDGSMPYIENARGQLEMSRAAFPEAERHFRRALDGRTGARARVSFRLNLAEALFAQSRNLDAVEHAREAEREAIGVGLASKLPEVYRLLGRIASAEADPDAFVLFERALEIARQEGLPALEEALTLQAYAASEARRGEEDAAGQLRERAAQLFEKLGIVHMRQAWADVYGPTQPPGATTETDP